MATNSKSKPAAAKRPGKTVKPAAKKAAAQARPKKASVAAKQTPKKASNVPAKPVKKPSAAPKTAPATAPKSKLATKGAPLSPRAPGKDLIKKTVKTAVSPNVVAKPVSAKAVTKPTEPKKPRFSKSDLDQFKADLMAMRDRITGQSGSMRNDALQRTDEINPEEDGTDAFMRLQTLEQVSSQQQIVANIDESLRAIEKGTYGVCDACGELINKPRLSVLPFAKNCIKCQSEMERTRRPGGRR